MAADTDTPAGDYTLVVRDDGKKQWAYKGKPLYYFTPDTNPGDTKGQGVGNVWFVVTPVAAPAPAAAPAAAPVPAALPTTSDGGSIPIGALALVGLLLGTLGALIRPRRQRGRV